MTNKTYWAIKHREWASREQRTTRGNRRNVPLVRGAKAAPAPEAPESVVVVEKPTAEPYTETETITKETYEVEEKETPKPKASKAKKDSE